MIDGLGKMVHEGHKVWEWRFDRTNERVLRENGGTVEIYVKNDHGSGDRGCNSIYSFSHTDSVDLTGLDICSITPVTESCLKVSSHIKDMVNNLVPETFLDVLDDWGCTWLWEKLRVSGAKGTGLNLTSATGFDWIFQAIEDESLVGVTDGSYFKQFYPHLCSAAVVLECSKGRGRLILSFADHCLQANAYRGELMGLMALHLLLLSFNKVKLSLGGSVHIYSDCMGALNKVEHLPPQCIPSKCRHSDILKNIMVNCSSLSFKRLFSHVKAHQDELDNFGNLDRPAQLNCVCDGEVKQTIFQSDLTNLPPQQAFPLEAITLFVDNQKVTMESGPVIRYSAHRQEA
jgi:hypothetical protein